MLLIFLRLGTYKRLEDATSAIGAVSNRVHRRCARCWYVVESRVWKTLRHQAMLCVRHAM